VTASRCLRARSAQALQELSRAGPEASEQLPTRLRSGEAFFGDEERKEQETNPEKEKTESADNRSVKLWAAGFPYESLFPDLEGPAEAIGIGALRGEGGLITN